MVSLPQLSFLLCSHCAVTGPLSLLGIAACHEVLVMKVSMILQVCKRTAADKKGGHLAVNRTTGGLLLREVIPLCSAFDVASVVKMLHLVLPLMCAVFHPTTIACCVRYRVLRLALPPFSV